MKRIALGSLSFLLFVALVHGCGREDEAVSRKAAIEAVVRDFLELGAKRDIAKLQGLIHEDFQFHVSMGGELRSLPRDKFLELAEIGDPKENVELRQCDVIALTEDETTVNVVSSSSHRDGTELLSSEMILKKAGDTWKLLEVKLLEARIEADPNDAPA